MRCEFLEKRPRISRRKRKKRHGMRKSRVARAPWRRSPRWLYASKVSYGVTSEADEPAMSWCTRAGTCTRAPARNRAFAAHTFHALASWLHTCTYVRTCTRGSLGGCSLSAARSGAQELICGSGKRNRSNNIPYYDVTRDTGSRVRVSRAYRVDHAPVPCT